MTARSVALPRALALAVPRRLRRRPSLRAVVLAVLGFVGVGGGWMWLRDSSLVAVSHVTVVGAGGPDGAQIRAALTTAARDMTTMDVHVGELRTAVARYPLVKDVEARSHFPHGLTIVVHERLPVGSVLADGRHVPVAGDGTLLRSVAVPNLPTIPMAAPPGGDRLSDKRALGAVAVLAAAPAVIRTHITRVFVGPHGLTAQLRDGPSLYFGPARRLAAKWAAAVRVLADVTARGATYIDLRVPERPAAGGLESSTPPPDTPLIPPSVSQGAAAAGGAGAASTAATGATATGTGAGTTGGPGTGATAGTGAATTGTGATGPGATGGGAGGAGAAGGTSPPPAGP